MNNQSYEKYFQSSLMALSDYLKVSAFKRIEYDPSNRQVNGLDYHIKVFFSPPNGERRTLLEFVVDRMFWHQANTNKADRSWMRTHADAWLDPIRKAHKNRNKKNA